MVLALRLGHIPQVDGPFPQPNEESSEYSGEVVRHELVAWQQMPHRVCKFSARSVQGEPHNFCIFLKEGADPQTVAESPVEPLWMLLVIVLVHRSIKLVDEIIPHKNGWVVATKLPLLAPTCPGALLLEYSVDALVCIRKGARLRSSLFFHL